MNFLSLLLALACFYATVIAARDVWWWFDVRWTTHLAEILSTTIIAIFMLVCGIAFFLAGVNGLPGVRS